MRNQIWSGLFLFCRTRRWGRSRPYQKFRAVVSLPAAVVQIRVGREGWGGAEEKRLRQRVAGGGLTSGEGSGRWAWSLASLMLDSQNTDP